MDWSTLITRATIPSSCLHKSHLKMYTSRLLFVCLTTVSILQKKKNLTIICMKNVWHIMCILSYTRRAAFFLMKILHAIFFQYLFCIFLCIYFNSLYPTQYRNNIQILKLLSISCLPKIVILWTCNEHLVSTWAVGLL